MAHHGKCCRDNASLVCLDTHTNANDGHNINQCLISIRQLAVGVLQ